MRSSRADLSRMRASITVKQRRRSSGNWAAWAPAAMRFTRVALVALRRSILCVRRQHHGTFPRRYPQRRSSSPTDWDLERVLSAIRASVLEAPANPGMGTRFMHLYVFNLHFHNGFVAAQATAECTPARTFGKSGQGFHRRHSMPCSMGNDCTRWLVSAHPSIPSTLRCHIVRDRVAQHPARSSTTPSVSVEASSMDDTSPDDRRTRRVPSVLSPSSVASIRLSTMLSPSTCRFLRMSRLHLRASAPATPLPPSHDASPAAPSASPQAFAFGAHKLQYVFEAVQARAKYARCVQLGRVRNAHHVIPTSTAAFSSTPRAGPSRSCDPSPRHAQGPSHFYEYPVLRRLLPPHPRT
ncbi:hypothetical protein B0H14DRAFT_335305 [Mycena olivaceomarginata]|nr:hypothetical protein B0H14DRAFT_335305 [Mycena olivaceomarginata]